MFPKKKLLLVVVGVTRIDLDLFENMCPFYISSYFVGPFEGRFRQVCPTSDCPFMVLRMKYCRIKADSQDIKCRQFMQQSYFFLFFSFLKQYFASLCNLNGRHNDHSE